jgi:glycosyltransferase involved in cell wall biosynthesis
MGCGCCVLARDTVFNREVLADSGMYFAPTADAVREQLDQIDHDEARAAALRAAAPTRIRQHYSWGKITDQYDRLFRSVTGR